MESATDMQTVIATGQIELFRIEANGIVSTEVYYATSTRSDVPPGLDSVEFRIGENTVLGFEDVGASFQIHKDNTLWGWYDSNEDGQQDEDEIQQFTVDDNVLEGIKNTTIGSSGTTGWTKTIPIINPGEYLWTKTIQIYSDGSMTVTYGLYHWGADANTYKIVTRFNEVIKFMQKDASGKTTYTFSPAKLPVTLWQQNSSGNTQLEINKDKLSVRLVNVMNNYSEEELDMSYYEEISGREIQIDLQKYSDSESEEGLAIDLKTLDSCYLKIVYEIQPNENIVEYIGVRFGSNYDMATLSLEATGWVSKVQDTFLTFDANGLTLVNGGVGIRNNEGKSVFYADNYGNLCLTGTITAKAGEIGGFEIGETSLKALLKDENGEVIRNAEGETYSTIELDGLNGKIYVGISSNNENQIIIDGPNGVIKSRTYDGGINGWSISHEEAIFNNIVAQGTIKASVFEYGRAQAVGGILLVRPSTRIIAVTENSINGTYIVELEEDAGFNINDYCLVELSGEGMPGSNERLYFTIIDKVDKKVTLKPESTGALDATKIPCLIINYGQKATDTEHGSIGIGINASDNNSIVQKNSISVFELGKDGQLNTHIVLGLLDENILQDFDSSVTSSYGLYADNVYLRGSLVTENKAEGNNQATYSGIGTVFGTNPPYSKKNLFENQGRLILWAGANSAEKNAIENAHFYVDECGNVYGNSVHLEGSLITKSYIEAAELRTAIIRGYNIGENVDAALTIQDTALGILFKKQKNGEYISVFGLGEEELFNALPLRMKEDINSTTYLEIEKNAIGFYVDKIFQSGIEFNNNNISLRTNNGKTAISGVFKIGNISYEPYKKDDVVLGYDLYVGEE